MKRVLAGLLLSAALAAPSYAALPAGAAAPDFQLKAALAGKDFNFSLAETLKKGPVVLYFFPAAFTAGCTVEANAFAEATDDFKAAGATVIGVTAGNIDRVAEFSQLECRNKFAVAADPGAVLAAKYDAANAERAGSSSRTSYVIGKDGKVAYSLTERTPLPHIENSLRVVKALKAKG
jgi:peroxiredoxin Q/BCP